MPGLTGMEAARKWAKRDDRPEEVAPNCGCAAAMASKPCCASEEGGIMAFGASEALLTGCSVWADAAVASA